MSASNRYSTIDQGPSRQMGLDVGEKTIGVAISDELGWTAQPLKTLRNKKRIQDLEKIKEIVEEYRISSIVVGLPLLMSGVEGSQARRVKAFASQLEKMVDVPVLFWDERFSTVAAERILIEADLSREKRKKQVDKIAAAIILQGYLDSLRAQQ